ncbi:amino acid ABC transporter permease [Candidatus Epulonipiscium fishelsonii]|uniref:Amino acid ABC transporter permease n=1 Tax=Candidatus Epulonipiscium fishelsonii TaxID=77094 RepID=A0ACC8XCM8_9FIRM|nr:amino acid ABC transporter permease [Epulopiscium sp. SCG-B11WGA-EpuloA1]ONI40764.1 amino acid ABC transporter permease [Epulopiscium sp. SCG-B05WGA-EpuloA1]
MDRTIAFFNAFFEGKYYLTVFDGIMNTLTLTAVATTIGMLIGLIVAIIQVIEKPKHGGISLVVVNFLKLIAKVYVDIIRGTPAVVQISFLWMVVLGPLQIPRVLVGGIAFGINSGAYMSEIIRGGILSIDKGQMEAGRSLGLTYIQTMREIILPQAARQTLPTLVNEFIVLIKETSIIGFIGGMDLMKAANIMIGSTYNYEIPLLMVALIYLCMTTIFTRFMRKVEKSISKER